MNYVKCMNGFLAVVLLAGLWSASNAIVADRLNRLEERGLIPYGPLPEGPALNYAYQGLNRAFNPGLPIRRVGEFSKGEFEELILTSLDAPSRARLAPYIQSILSLSVDYQIDPFWIIAVVMVESDFRAMALSSKNARGLMQILPGTAQYLYQLRQKKISKQEVALNLYRPDENLEMGIFYLKKLLQNFRMDYRFATVAYNMGPGRLRAHLKSKSLDVNRSAYLLKIKDRYFRLSQNFAKSVKARPHPYEATYAYLEQGLNWENFWENLRLQLSSENLTAQLF